MSPKILIIEDDIDSAKVIIERVRKMFGFDIKYIQPPREIQDLVDIVRKEEADGLIIDERLQQQSDANYFGVDVLNYFSRAIPQLPIRILTQYRKEEELKNVKNQQLIRKTDIAEDRELNEVMISLMEEIKNYRGRINSVESALENLRRESKNGLSKAFVVELANYYFLVDESIHEIHWLNPENVESNNIFLIETSRLAISTDTIDPFIVSIDEQIPFLVFIAEVSPSTWDEIQRENVRLPENWSLKKVVSIKNER